MPWERGDHTPQKLAEFCCPSAAFQSNSTMLDTLKKIAKRTPIGSVWNTIREHKYKRYLADISSDQPVHPLYCISCNRYYKEFTPLSSYYEELFEKHGFPYSIRNLETLNTTQYRCPVCKITDRDRLCALYLQKGIDPQRQYNLVEFAPSPQLSAFIRRYKNIRHRTADLFMDGVDDKADLVNMPVYADDSFDIFVCSHVLEHVDDDVKAMSELYRILKREGFGIAMVPLFKEVERTKEDPSIKDEALRWKYFGQHDHVRLYAKHEYIARLESVGFNVQQHGKEYFGQDVFQKNGIADSSVLYIVRK
jgi:SAM-dependent methyltransferase